MRGYIDVWVDRGYGFAYSYEGTKVKYFIHISKVQVNADGVLEIPRSRESY